MSTHPAHFVRRVSSGFCLLESNRPRITYCIPHVVSAAYVRMAVDPRVGGLYSGIQLSFEYEGFTAVDCAGSYVARENHPDKSGWVLHPEQYFSKTAGKLQCNMYKMAGTRACNICGVSRHRGHLSGGRGAVSTSEVIVAYQTK